jgi:hypothetical protein
MKQTIISLSFLLLTQQFSFASPYFKENRIDLSIPESCQQMDISFYSLPLEKFFVGREGAVAMGFTFEYPIKRQNATLLWQYFKDFTKGEGNDKLLLKIKKDPDLFRDYQIIMRNFEEQDFKFGSEGDVLELLAIEHMYQVYPENTYYITGGVEYHNSESEMTIGELDLYVGNRTDCSSVAVGEAKLGSGKMLGKAHQQLQRFESFLIEHHVPVIK